MSLDAKNKVVSKRGGCKRNPQQRELDLMLIEDMALRGVGGCRAIAAALNALPGRTYTLSHEQVNKDMHRIEEYWRERATESRDKAKVRLLSEIRKQKAELWAEWERSKTDAEKCVAEKMIRGGNVGHERITDTKENRCADTAYQSVLATLNEQEAKLMGLYAPQQQEIIGVTTNAPTPIVVQWADEIRDPVSIGPPTPEMPLIDLPRDQKTLTDVNNEETVIR